MSVCCVLVLCNYDINTTLQNHT